MNVNLELLEALKACVQYGAMTGAEWVESKAADAIAHAEAAMCQGHALECDVEHAACSCLALGGGACHLGDGCRAMEKVRRLSEPRNFCPRCGKRLRDGDVHTCTPPVPRGNFDDITHFDVED